jgi:hypothetical protein
VTGDDQIGGDREQPSARYIGAKNGRREQDADPDADLDESDHAHQELGRHRNDVQDEGTERLEALTSQT